MLSNTVIHQTLERFPDLSSDDFEVRPLEKGGSGRKFYRVRAGGDQSLIVVKYTDEREENRHYVSIAQYLTSTGVQVPRIYFHDSSEGLIWMQDLGEDDLWSHREADWSVRRPLYESALQEVCKLHTAATQRYDGSSLKLEREFSEPLYLWEQSYFFENCLRGHFGVEEDAASRYANLPVLQNIAAQLATRPRVLVHRDFQSQNILVQDGSAWLIDFQGMRPGLPQYDLASLLYDPYVTFSASERESLLESYKRLARQAGLEIPADFDEVFYQCALQRLMQALGAYGFLGRQKGKPAFLAHIPAARASLREVAARLDGLDEFVVLLDGLPEAVS